jgi:mono/diheme cytochrome c family protein
VKRIDVPDDRIRRVARRMSAPLGGPGSRRESSRTISQAEPEAHSERLQPLNPRFIVALPLVLPFVLAAGALLFAGPAARAQQAGADSAPAGNAQNGKKNFTSDGCYECHGLQGQGATQTGAARIGPPQLALESFISYVRHPTNQMPPYTSKAISDQDLTDIYAYLKSFPLPPKGKDIPLLNK